jgi:hypothetical protein
MSMRAFASLVATLALGCGGRATASDPGPGADAGIADSPTADTPLPESAPDVAHTGCAFAIVATGSILDPSDSVGGIHGLDVFASPSGFVVSFREDGHEHGRFTHAWVGDDGEQGPSTSTPLDTLCDLQPARIGSAWSETAGLGLVAAACGEQQVLTTVDELGVPLEQIVMSMGGTFSMAPADGLTPGDTQDLFYLAGVAQGRGVLLTTFGTMLTAGVTLIPGGEGATSAHVAASPGLVAVLANADGGERPYSLSYGDIQLPKYTTVELAEGSAGALEVWDDRVAAAVARAPGVAWWEVRVDSGLVQRGEVAMPEPDGLELLRLGDRLFVVGAENGAVTVAALEDQESGRVERARITLDHEDDLPHIALSAGALLAAAAARDTLMIAWGGTTTVLDTDIVEGRVGYALLRCLPAR